MCAIAHPSVFITYNNLNIILMGQLVHMEVSVEMAIALIAPLVCCDHLLILLTLSDMLPSLHF